MFNYEVVHILARTLDDDVEMMPAGPGPISASMHSPLASPAVPLASPRALSIASNANTSDRRDFSENLSVASSNDVGELLYDS